MRRMLLTHIHRLPTLTAAALSAICYSADYPNLALFLGIFAAVSGVTLIGFSFGDQHDS